MLKVHIIVRGFTHTIAVFSRLIFLITFCESALADAECRSRAHVHRANCIRFWLYIGSRGEFTWCIQIIFSSRCEKGRVSVFSRRKRSTYTSVFFFHDVQLIYLYTYIHMYSYVYNMQYICTWTTYLLHSNNPGDVKSGKKWLRAFKGSLACPFTRRRISLYRKWLPLLKRVKWPGDITLVNTKESEGVGEERMKVVVGGGRERKK